MYLLRNALRSDLQDLRVLARMLDTVNLPDDERALSAILDESARSFDGRIRDPLGRRYVFALEDPRRGRVVGTSMIIAQHGTRESPCTFFDVSEREHYSSTLDRWFRHQVLSIGYHFDGPTEIGGLVVHPRERRREEQAGKQLSFVRFLYVAMHRDRFRDRMLAELMPPLTPEGKSLFWEACGRRFTGLDYQDIRDDRVYSYFNLKNGETKAIEILANASYLGKYYLPMISVEPMYDATINARIKGQWVQVVAPDEK